MPVCAGYFPSWTDVIIIEPAPLSTQYPPMILSHIWNRFKIKKTYLYVVAALQAFQLTSWNSKVAERLATVPPFMPC
jgi:hypothetical protein